MPITLTKYGWTESKTGKRTIVRNNKEAIYLDLIANEGFKWIKVLQIQISIRTINKQ